MQIPLDGLRDIIEAPAIAVFDNLLDEVLVNKDDAQDRRSLSPPSLAACARRVVLTSEHRHNTYKTRF